MFKPLPPPSFEIDLTLPTPEATVELGRALAGLVRPGFLVTLEGPLGSGKTLLTQALLSQLGVAGRVKSPTYTLMEPYDLGHFMVCHFDFYRFSGQFDADDAGFREHFNPETLCIVEWPEKAADWLPNPDIHLEWLPAAAGRRVRLRIAPTVDYNKAVLNGIAPRASTE